MMETATGVQRRASGRGRTPARLPDSVVHSRSSEWLVLIPRIAPDSTIQTPFHSLPYCLVLVPSKISLLSLSQPGSYLHPKKHALLEKNNRWCTQQQCAWSYIYVDPAIRHACAGNDQMNDPSALQLGRVQHVLAAAAWTFFFIFFWRNACSWWKRPMQNNGFIHH